MSMSRREFVSLAALFPFTFIRKVEKIESARDDPGDLLVVTLDKPISPTEQNNLKRALETLGRAALIVPNYIRVERAGRAEATNSLLIDRSGHGQ